MGNKKTGVSMGGSIEYTRTKEKKQFINKINAVKKKNSKICIECENNKEGYCMKHNGWCGKVNHICNGYEISYQEKLQNDRFEHKSKNRKQEEKMKKKLKNKATKNSNKK